MKTILGVSHVAMGINYAEKFPEAINDRVNEMQKLGWEVEIQYAEGNTYSALIIGRKENKHETY